MVSWETVMSRFAAPLTGWRSGAGAWAGHARDSIHSWTVVPLSLAAITLAAVGFWLGSVTGASGGGDAGPVTSTIRIQGQVVTVGGVRYVSTPAQVVNVRGRAVHIAARTVPLAANTNLLPGTTVRISQGVPTTVNRTTVRTVVQTVTVTGPGTTVTGPTTTVQTTVTLPVISTVTITLP
jgi:hypothetical protein